MNAATICVICGDAAEARERLSCTPCGRRYQFAASGESTQVNCGIVAPNPTRTAVKAWSTCAPCAHPARIVKARQARK